VILLATAAVLVNASVSVVTLLLATTEQTSPAPMPGQAFWYPSKTDPSEGVAIKLNRVPCVRTDEHPEVAIFPLEITQSIARLPLTMLPDPVPVAAIRNSTGMKGTSTDLHPEA
jgi:hypothetical protein